MPELSVNGAKLYYEVAGSGPQTIVFCHGLLMSTHLFDAQVRALSAHYRCISFDFRGQGRSEVTEDGYDMETLAADTAALIEALGGAPVHLAGLSMGGFVGLRLAARRPDLVRSLILLNTSAEPEPAENMFRYRAMGLVGRWLGFKPLARRIMPIMFGQDFLTDPDRAEDVVEWRMRLLGNDRLGTYRALHGVIERRGVTEELARIGCPTLIIAGAEDVATLPVKSERMHAAIAGSRLVIVPRCGHSSSVEQPATVTATIEEFLEAQVQPDAAVTA